MVNSDEYDRSLIKRLVDSENWWKEVGNNGDNLNKLYLKISEDIKTDSISGKIALIFLQHQLFHELLLDLISASILYLQGEIWPARIVLPYDEEGGRTTGWYLNYYEKHCLDCMGKAEYIEAFKKLNRIRNRVAHELVGIKAEEINQFYKDFIKISSEVMESYNECAADVHRLLVDLNKRVDFKELI